MSHWENSISISFLINYTLISRFWGKIIVPVNSEPYLFVKKNKLLIIIITGKHGSRYQFKNLLIADLLCKGSWMDKNRASEFHKSWSRENISLFSAFSHWLFNLGKGVDTEQVTSRQLPKSIGCGKNFQGREALNTQEKVMCLVICEDVALQGPIPYTLNISHAF